MLDVNDYYDILIANGVSEEVLNVVTYINGYSRDTLDDIAYAVFGYRSVLDLLDEDVNDSIFDWLENFLQVPINTIDDDAMCTTFFDVIAGDVSCYDVATCEEYSAGEMYVLIAEEAISRALS